MSGKSQKNAMKRLMNEWRAMQKSPSHNCYAYPKRRHKHSDDVDLFHWTACIFGPIDTPYEGGLFYLDINLSKSYPFKPPNVRFLTKVYHPNISFRTGVICVDILKDAWTPAYSIASVLESICSLLNAPNPDDPLVADIAHTYKYRPEIYEANARQWTQRYAQESQPEDESSD